MSGRPVSANQNGWIGPQTPLDVQGFDYNTGSYDGWHAQAPNSAWEEGGEDAHLLATPPHSHPASQSPRSARRRQVRSPTAGSTPITRRPATSVNLCPRRVLPKCDPCPAPPFRAQVTGYDNQYPGWGESAEQAWGGVGVGGGQGILTRPFISGGWTWTGARGMFAAPGNPSRPFLSQRRLGLQGRADAVPVA